MSHSRAPLSAAIVVLLVLAQHAVPILEVRTATTVLYVALFAAALALRLGSVFHLTALLALSGLLPALLPALVTGVSAVYLAVLFVASLPLLRFSGEPQPVRSWMRRGTVDRFAVASIVVVSLVSAAALILWASWTDDIGAGERMVRGLATVPKALVLLVGVPLFSLLNAFSEEVVYRGVFQEAALRSRLPPWAAIALQASAFAVLHFAAGFPNDYIGYLMTFVYGGALGYLRHRTGGLLVPYLTHVTADLVIVYYLCVRFL